VLQYDHFAVSTPISKRVSAIEEWQAFHQRLKRHNVLQGIGGSDSAKKQGANFELGCGVGNDPVMGAEIDGCK